MGSAKDGSLNRIMVIGVISVCAIVGAYGGIILYLSWPISFGNVDKAGVFGDSFGILTAWFSGLAFAGIVFTIYLQKKELEETRNVFKKQLYENTFFQMLKIHNDIVNATDLRKGGKETARGRDCFESFFNRLKMEYDKEKESFNETEINYIESSYKIFWYRNQNNLGHYFRYLYNIFKFIKNNDIEDKKFYSNLVRAQLSDFELLIIFYNCLCEYGVENFKPLVEEFALFDNLPKSRLLDKSHAKLFEVSAFGESFVD